MGAVEEPLVDAAVGRALLVAGWEPVGVGEQLGEAGGIASQASAEEATAPIAARTEATNARTIGVSSTYSSPLMTFRSGSNRSSSPARRGRRFELGRAEMPVGLELVRGAGSQELGLLPRRPGERSSRSQASRGCPSARTPARRSVSRLVQSAGGPRSLLRSRRSRAEADAAGPRRTAPDCPPAARSERREPRRG